MNIVCFRRHQEGPRDQTRAVESHYETRLHIGGDNSASYPALLCTEKPCGAHTCEYTQVWNMHPTGLCGGNDLTYSSTLDRQPPPSCGKTTSDNRTSSFTPGSFKRAIPGSTTGSNVVPPDCSISEQGAERISLDNLRPSIIEATVPVIPKVPTEPFTPAYYELEAKLQANNKTLPKRDQEFSEFHVMFREPVEPL